MKLEVKRLLETYFEVKNEKLLNAIELNLIKYLWRSSFAFLFLKMLRIKFITENGIDAGFER